MRRWLPSHPPAGQPARRPLRVGWGSVVRRAAVVGLCSLLGLSGTDALAAPDEQALCKDRGYPVGTPSRWFFDECTRVGSFTHQGEIPGLFGGQANTMRPSSEPMPLPAAPQPPDYRWRVGTETGLSIDDYLARQRVMALLVVRNGVLEVERYQYDRTASHRFLTNSIAKTVTALAIGMAAQEGKLALDDRADRHAPALAGTLYGDATVRQLLRMSSGARFEERYDGKDDLARYGAAALRGGAAAGAKVITERAHGAGAVFNYASAETDMLALVLRGATGQTLSQWLEPRLWQPLGAETSALWRAGADGLERAGGNLNATARDWARLGVLLAHDGPNSARCCRRTFYWKPPTGSATPRPSLRARPRPITATATRSGRFRARSAASRCWACTVRRSTWTLTKSSSWCTWPPTRQPAPARPAWAARWARCGTPSSRTAGGGEGDLRPTEAQAPRSPRPAGVLPQRCLSSTSPAPINSAMPAQAIALGTKPQTAQPSATAISSPT